MPTAAEGIIPKKNTIELGRQTDSEGERDVRIYQLIACQTFVVFFFFFGKQIMSNTIGT